MAVPFHSSFARQASTPKTLILAIRKIQRHLQATSSASHEGQNRFEPGRWSILALGSRTILEIGSDRFRLFGFQRELRPRGGDQFGCSANHWQQLAAAITVCQSQPRSAATPDTARP